MLVKVGTLSAVGPKLAMSKGKRKSDREALELVRQRLRCRTVHFTEQDKHLLSLLCRTDIIQIIEVDLGLGPLKTSQKNSVATMVGWLLARRWVDRFRLCQCSMSMKRTESVYFWCIACTRAVRAAWVSLAADSCCC